MSVPLLCLVAGMTLHLGGAHADAPLLTGLSFHPGRARSPGGGNGQWIQEPLLNQVSTHGWTLPHLQQSC